jgi:hypothetical protein
MKAFIPAFTLLVLAETGRSFAQQQSQECLDSEATLRANETLQVAAAQVENDFVVGFSDMCEAVNSSEVACFWDYADLSSYDNFIQLCREAGGKTFTTDYDVECKDDTRDKITIQILNGPGCAGMGCNLDNQEDENVRRFLDRLGSQNFECKEVGGAIGKILLPLFVTSLYVTWMIS